ncbi:hypothetical protein V5F53_10950 [Xanthobacter sp. V4C-4]|uniref:hypothetical protein n=1 Tax=Xanthobacter cornucopiae TaxID=3119924 RepID=UPI00372A3C99
MARHPILEDHLALHREASAVAMNILHRQALRSLLTPPIITYAHPVSQFGAPIKILDAQTRALIDAAIEARRS